VSCRPGEYMAFPVFGFRISPIIDQKQLHSVTNIGTAELSHLSLVADHQRSQDGSKLCHGAFWSFCDCGEVSTTAVQRRGISVSLTAKSESQPPDDWEEKRNDRAACKVSCWRPGRIAGLKKMVLMFAMSMKHNFDQTVKGIQFSFELGIERNFEGASYLLIDSSNFQSSCKPSSLCSQSNN
jgi:hypothetical protein